MRHRVSKKTLNRTKDQRRALISGLAAQIIEHGKVDTTLAKAKVVKPFVEKMVTKAVKANRSGDKIVKFNAVKNLRKHLRSESAIKKLMEEVSLLFMERPGGYTRIVKTGERAGDRALTARIEFVESLEKAKAKTKVPAQAGKAKPKTSEKEKAEKIPEERKDEKNTK